MTADDSRGQGGCKQAWEPSRGGRVNVSDLWTIRDRKSLSYRQEVTLPGSYGQEAHQPAVLREGTPDAITVFTSSSQLSVVMHRHFLHFISEPNVLTAPRQNQDRTRTEDGHKQPAESKVRGQFTRVTLTCDKLSLQDPLRVSYALARLC